VTLDAVLQRHGARERARGGATSNTSVAAVAVWADGCRCHLKAFKIALPGRLGDVVKVWDRLARRALASVRWSRWWGLLPWQCFGRR
jgi:hypothetical protein